MVAREAPKTHPLVSTSNHSKTGVCIAIDHTHTHTLFKGLHTHLRQVIAPGTSSAPSWKKTQKRKNGTSTAEKNSLGPTIRQGKPGGGLRAPPCCRRPRAAGTPKGKVGYLAKGGEEGGEQATGVREVARSVVGVARSTPAFRRIGCLHSCFAWRLGRSEAGSNV